MCNFENFPLVISTTFTRAILKLDLDLSVLLDNVRFMRINETVQNEQPNENDSQYTRKRALRKV